MAQVAAALPPPPPLGALCFQAIRAQALTLPPPPRCPPCLQWQKAAAEGIKPAATPNYSVTDEAAAGAEAVSLGQVGAAGVRQPRRSAGHAVRLEEQEGSAPSWSSGGHSMPQASPLLLPLCPPSPALTPPRPPAPSPACPQLMAFSGPAPELINGRLSMLAFVAALGAELATGEPVLRQLGDEPTGEAAALLVALGLRGRPVVG